MNYSEHSSWRGSDAWPGFPGTEAELPSPWIHGDPNLVPLRIRTVRPSLIESLPATVVLERTDAARDRALALHLPNRDAHALFHELNGRVTLRSQAVHAIARMVNACNGSLLSVELRSAASGLVRTSATCLTNGERVDIPLEPGQALALAVVLGVPISGDPELLLAPETEDDSDPTVTILPFPSGTFQEGARL